MGYYCFKSHYSHLFAPVCFHLFFLTDDENSDAFSEMTSALVEHDPTLDLVDLASTPSISSIELDGDFIYM